MENSVILKEQFNAMKKNNYLKQIYYLLAFTVFLAGVVIYVFFRNTNNIILFDYIPKLSFLSTLYISVKKDSIWFYMLQYNLPDGLWCLSALLLIRIIWLANTSWRAMYSGIFIVMALFFEFLQIFEKIPGTFDLFDLLFICTFAFLESIIFYYFIKRRINYDEKNI
jgi:hypothetical protein